jgi:hypothetical protein
MSNALAIAATTRTLRNLLDGVATADYSGLPNDTRPTAQIELTTLPLDRVRLPDASRNRLNVFLYQTARNTGWSNQDMPRRTRPGENGFPPLALDLYYIVTAYAENDSDLIGQVLLGTAMRILHDHPVLSRAEIRNALALAELDTQIERLRIAPQPVSLDELSKLWSGFQSEYRLSPPCRCCAAAAKTADRWWWRRRLRACWRSSSSSTRRCRSGRLTASRRRSSATSWSSPAPTSAATR